MDIKSTGCHDCRVARVHLDTELTYCALMDGEEVSVQDNVTEQTINVACPLKASNCTLVLYKNAVVPYATAKLYETE